jgi:hypothetical protein
MSDTTSTVIEDPYEDDDEYDEGRGPGRIIAIAVVVALALGVGGYFAGHASAGGPSTLAEAVQQASEGKLACGASPAVPTTAAGGAGATQGAAPGAGGGFAAGGANANAFLVRQVCARGTGNGAGTGTPGAGGGGFGAGRTGAGARGRFGAGGLFGGPGSTTGRVASVSGSTITLTGANGNTTVKVGPNTAVTKTAKGAASDIKPGDTVVASGTGQNGQGTATGIFILPATGRAQGTTQ